MPDRTVGMPRAGVEGVAELGVPPMEFRMTPTNIWTTLMFFRRTPIFLREAGAALASPDVLRDESDPFGSDSDFGWSDSDVG